jgi:hypothetical protein
MFEYFLKKLKIIFKFFDNLKTEILFTNLQLKLLQKYEYS